MRPGFADDPSLWEVAQGLDPERALLDAIERDAAAAQARCPKAAAEIDRRVAGIRRRLSAIARERRQLRALGAPREVTRG